MWKLDLAAEMKKGLHRGVEFMKGQSSTPSAVLPETYVIYSMRDCEGSDDTEEAIFQVPTHASVQDVIDAFPIPGIHSFRFKVSDEQFGHVWLHADRSSELAPKYGSNICLQVLQQPDCSERKTTQRNAQVNNVQTVITPCPDRAELIRARLGAEAAQVEAARHFAAHSAMEESTRRQDKLEMQNQIGSELDKWALTEQGKLKDVRSLLSTVETVLWANSGWVGVPIGELMMNESAVKKSWRKAIIMCHPDRHQQASAEQQYRADRVFNAINESYKGFTGRANPQQT